MTTTAGIQHDHTLTVICQGQVGLERSDQRVVLAAVVHRLHHELQLRRNMVRQARYLLECLRARLDLPIVLRALRLLLRLRKARRLLGCILDRLELRFAPRLDRQDLRIVLRPKRHELRIACSALPAFICASTRPVATVDAALVASMCLSLAALFAAISASCFALFARSSATCSVLRARRSLDAAALISLTSASPSALIAASFSSRVSRSSNAAALATSASPSALIAASSSSRVSRSSNAAALAFRVVLLYLTQANTKSEVSPKESTVTIGGEKRRGHTECRRGVFAAVGRRAHEARIRPLTSSRGDTSYQVRATYTDIRASIH